MFFHTHWMVVGHFVWGSYHSRSPHPLRVADSWYLLATFARCIGFRFFFFCIVAGTDCAGNITLQAAFVSLYIRYKTRLYFLLHMDPWRSKTLGLRECATRVATKASTNRDLAEASRLFPRSLIITASGSTSDNRSEPNRPLL